MDVSELNEEGLKRSYKIVIPGSEVAGKVDARVGEIAKTMKLPGFRPGKVPTSLVRKQHGQAILGEVLEETVRESTQKALEDRELRPAMQPKIEVGEFNDGDDLSFQVDFEVLPTMPEVDGAKLSLERLTSPISDERIDEALQRLADQQREFHDPDADRVSENGDRIKLDFTGSVDGEEFEGGKAEDHELVLGSGNFIPGFEDQLVGHKAGADVSVNVTFPENYGAENLAGKDAVFACVIKEVSAGKDVAIDDELAKKVGLEDLAALRTAMTDRFQEEHDQASRLRIKRQVLDQLADAHDFDVPEGMVELEFDAIWKQFNDEMLRQGGDYEKLGKTEDEARDEYRGIAERRVRLGLLLSDVGNKNEIKVEQEELNMAVSQQLRQFPGQEQQFIDYLKNTPQALEQIRAPIFEDKVVDFLIELANVEEREVTVEELMRDPDEDAGDASSSDEKASD